ncbi:MAG: type I-C CRISPR-associated endonuclease Cas1c [Verrucomicrobiae bacterium]|nr:type I-C CRISPR-associated endonuclease Cas1c [Verrucomicrobiae bacterium]
MNIQQNTLYLTTAGSYVGRDHLTLQVEVPVYPPDLPPEKRTHEAAVDWRRLSIPIHHLESICVFGASTISPPALDLCWEHGVAVNFLSENGYFMARMTGVADTSVMLRRAQFRAADDPAKCAAIARQIIAGKLQNARTSLLRAARENGNDAESQRLQEATDSLARQIRRLEALEISSLRSHMDEIRGAEGMAGQTYFSVFTLMLKQQRDAFAFTTRTRRPPRDRINCLLSFLYALLRHDCIAALTAAGLDPFVGFLHADRPNRPSLALDLMEEFRPWLADRLAITLINRQQIGPEHFKQREGGAVELTETGRKLVIKAYQERKQESLTHPLLDQTLRIAQMPYVQARVLARHLRSDVPDYVPLVPR